MKIVNEYVTKSINLKGHRIGNRYAEVLGQVLQDESQKFRQKFNLEKNNLQGR